jgi:hypothetical protein
LQAPAARADKQYGDVLKSYKQREHAEDELYEVVKQPIPWVAPCAIASMATESLTWCATQKTGQLALSKVERAQKLLAVERAHILYQGGDTQVQLVRLGSQGVELDGAGDFKSSCLEPQRRTSTT